MFLKLNLGDSTQSTFPWWKGQLDPLYSPNQQTHLGHHHPRQRHQHGGKGLQLVHTQGCQGNHTRRCKQELQAVLESRTPGTSGHTIRSQRRNWSQSFTAEHHQAWTSQSQTSQAQDTGKPQKLEIQNSLSELWERWSKAVKTYKATLWWRQLQSKDHPGRKQPSYWLGSKLLTSLLTTIQMKAPSHSVLPSRKKPGERWGEGQPTEQPWNLCISPSDLVTYKELSRHWNQGSHPDQTAK